MDNEKLKDIEDGQESEHTALKAIRHNLNLTTGEHRQWKIENYGTDEEIETEIFKGDPDWEE